MNEVPVDCSGGRRIGIINPTTGVRERIGIKNPTTGVHDCKSRTAAKKQDNGLQNDFKHENLFSTYH